MFSGNRHLKPRLCKNLAVSATNSRGRVKTPETGCPLNFSDLEFGLSEKPSIFLISTKRFDYKDLIPVEVAFGYQLITNL
jgi:hypothetical protein